MTKNDVCRAMRAIAVAIALIAGVAVPANAQGFVSPFIGYDFGGDSGCPQIDDCEDKKLNVGVGLGTLGTVVGFELELGYAKNFFGEAPGLASSVLTLMSNLMLAPRIGPVRPYGTAGIGLLKTRIELTPSDLLESSNHMGWNIGGGLMIFAGERLGIRGDIRHFHAFQDFSVLGVSIGDTKLDFARASAALVLSF